jgi:anaerobic selenocysteine-containing dehydrogenase
VGFGAALAKVPFIAALTPFVDETSAHAHVLLPTRAYLEEWGDDVPAVIPPGVRMATLRQPVIDPQFIGGNGVRTETPPAPWMDTRMAGDVLIDLARRLGRPLAATDMRDAVRRTWATLGQADLRATTTDNDRAWVNALSHGGYWAAGASAPAVGRVPAASPPPAPPAASGTFLLHLYPHIYWTDGRHANLPWLQENPDPMTMSVWNSWVEINMDVAHRMGIRTGDIVRLRTGHGVVDVPAVPYPGLHPGAVAMPIGQGHTAYGRYAQQGENPLTFLDPTADAATGALAFGATRVTLEKLRDATAGYHPELQTLVQLQDRPGGHEPDAVKDLIHTTAREWKEAKRVYGAPQAEGSIFKRTGGGAVENKGFSKPGE